MIFGRVISAAVAASTIMIAGAAQAATYNITEILSYTDNGFGSSLIHDQTNGTMSGGVVANFDSVVSGTYDTVTDIIQFSGTISLGGLSSTFDAFGTLEDSPGRTDGLFGSITFTFLGDLLDGLMLPFDFADQTFTSGGEPNGFASNGTNDFIALWGDNGQFGGNQCAGGTCLGMDLRLAIEPVPLPATGLLLLAGIGGLGAARRLRKAA